MTDKTNDQTKDHQPDIETRLARLEEAVSDLHPQQLSLSLPFNFTSMKKRELR